MCKGLRLERERYVHEIQRRPLGNSGMKGLETTLESRHYYPLFKNEEPEFREVNKLGQLTQLLGKNSGRVD